MNNKSYGKKVAISLDQLATVVFSPLLNACLPQSPNNMGVRNGISRFGYETLSSVFAKNAEQVGWCYVMYRILNVFDPEHCKKSIENDEGNK